LAERIGITEENLSLLKSGKVKAYALKLSKIAVPAGRFVGIPRCLDAATMQDVTALASLTMPQRPFAGWRATI
jgi:hypothetical protein